MTVTPTITRSDGRLAVRGRTVLTGVPDNVSAAHASGAGLVNGAFVGADAGEAKSLHVFTFGTLQDCRFLCLFRFKLWWMTQRMGVSGRDVPLETQFMLIEVPPAAGDDGDDGEPVYVVMLPLLEGQFRAALQGNDRDELEICIESGDKAVQTDQGANMVYIHAGDNPFDTITAAVKAVKHMQTFHHREKKLPSFLDWFGWCTWDAFYTDVTADAVKHGLQSLANGGAPPRFLIIDDGWQQIGNESKPDPDVAVQEGAQFASRLTGINENAKFQTDDKVDDDGEQAPGVLKRLVAETKACHGVRQVYVWHAMAGYWGGVAPSPGTGMERYEPALAYPVQCPGVTGNQPNIVMDSLSVLGLGLVHPRKVYSFYGELHAYLASCGVDGVKVDVQNIIETLGAGHGGRVAITRAYHRALEASVARSFPDNGCISCMCHNTDMLYSARQTAVVRASDDFYPRDPASHTVHVASVAYNTLFLGEFMQPDWDMFHSLHPAAEYHGAARAIGGCPIYVSDKPGNHNFDLLKKLILPDGSVLRAPRAAPRPPHPRLPLLRPGTRRRKLAQDLEREQVRRRGGRLQLPGSRVVPRHQEDTRPRRGAGVAHRHGAHRRRRRHRARLRRRRRRRLVGRRGRRVRAPRGGARPAAPRRRAAGDARGARIRGVPRLPRPRSRAGRLVRAGRADRHVQRRRGRRGVCRERRRRRGAPGARVRPVRRLLLAEAGQVPARLGGRGVQLRRRHGARRRRPAGAGARAVPVDAGDSGLGRDATRGRLHG